jgi:hypothetical protein
MSVGFEDKNPFTFAHKDLEKPLVQVDISASFCLRKYLALCFLGLPKGSIAIISNYHFQKTNIPNNITESVDTIQFVEFEVLTAVTTKNILFWDIKIQFVPHRRHITSPLQGPAG